MRKSHYDWKQKVLSERQYLILTGGNNVELCFDKEDALEKLSSKKPYENAKVFVKKDIGQIFDNEKCLVLRGFTQVAVIGSKNDCLKNIYVPLSYQENKSIWVQI